MKVGRLGNKKNIDAVFKNGFRINVGAVIIRVSPRPDLKRHRVAVICSKGVLPRAVDRNRIRRVFFESAAGILRKFELPVDLVVTIRKGFKIEAARLEEAKKFVEAVTTLIKRQ